MNVLTREEFDALVTNFGHACYDRSEDRTELLAAYDAALARIAELDPLNKRIVLKLHEIVNRNPLPEGSLGQNLEDVIDRQVTALMRENELLGQHNARLQQRIAELESPAHRARIAREFEHEAQLEYEASPEYPAGPHPAIAAGNRVLARWEAAAKEGE